MKYIMLITMLSLCIPVYAQFPTNKFTQTLDLADQGPGHHDFLWYWNREDLEITITMENDGAALDMSGFGVQFLMVSRTSAGTNQVAISNGTSDITISTSNLTFTVAFTSVPEAGTYKAELLLVDGSTNIVRPLARGRIEVNEDLFP